MSYTKYLTDNIDRNELTVLNPHLLFSPSKTWAMNVFCNIVELLPQLGRRLKNPERIMVGQLNINSRRNNFEYITEIICEHVFLVLEARLDCSLTRGQFHIQNYSKPYMLDWIERGGGIMLHFKERMQSIFKAFYRYR